MNGLERLTLGVIEGLHPVEDDRPSEGAVGAPRGKPLSGLQVQATSCPTMS
jgi:hypothetical protein